MMAKIDLKFGTESQSCNVNMSQVLKGLLQVISLSISTALAWMINGSSGRHDVSLHSHAVISDSPDSFLFTVYKKSIKKSLVLRVYSEFCVSSIVYWKVNTILINASHELTQQTRYKSLGTGMHPMFIATW